MAGNSTRSQAKEASGQQIIEDFSTASPTPASLSNLVSNYQTSIGIQSLLDSTSGNSSAQETRPNSTGIVEVLSGPSGDENVPVSEHPGARPVETGLSDSVQQYLKNFQQVYDPKDVANVAASIGKQTTVKKQAKFSRTSISSLINSDESVPSSNAAPKPTTQTEKRKRASPKGESAAKKAKTDTSKKAAKSDAKPDVKKDAKKDTKIDAKKESKTDTKKDTKTDTKKESKTDAKKDVKADVSKDAKPEPKRASKQETKVEPKKIAKAKKKTPEVILPSQDKPSIHPTMTTEKAKGPAPAVNLPAPSFVALEDSNTGELVLGSAAEDKEKQQVPIIALDIPLLDPKNPKPGQAEVVVNVLKLAEEKYGWSAVHPEARSAFELMDDVIDDEEDGDEEEDEELMIVDENGNPSKKKEGDNGDKKKKKQSQQSKVNRKVGKYDYEDPFIDDAELQWEEEITTTKEGFFVYWGPLIDERQSAKKSTAKGKK